MSLAWTTLAILLLILPGVFFFVGLATYERLSREIIRSGAVSEVAFAVVVAVALHTISISLLSAFGFRLSSFLAPLVDYPTTLTNGALRSLSHQLLLGAVYLLTTAAIGFGLGWLAAWKILTGGLRFLALHKWIYDVIQASRNNRIVTAYVMTNLVSDNKALMYRGRIHEIFLDNDGTISYIILKNCSKFYTSFDLDGLTTSKQRSLFEEQDEDRIWDYLFIEGENIANVLFDPGSKSIKQTPAGQEALVTELEKMGWSRKDAESSFGAGRGSGRMHWRLSD
jgi:hypothetical protein